MLKNVPVQLEGYKVRALEAPQFKTFQNDAGKIEQQTTPDGAPLYELSVFMRQRPQDGQRTPKGFEVKVTLETEPQESLEDEVVELVNPRISQWSRNGRDGVSLRATGVKLAG